MTTPTPRFLVTTGTRNGHLVVTKRADDPAGAAALAHEARVLRLARHPGVVQLLEFAGDGEGAVLTTAGAGSRTLASIQPSSLPLLLGLAVAAAETLGDLHRLGLVHGHVTADHIVVGGDSNAVLCGLRCGGPLASAYPPGHPRGGHPRRAVDDVIGLASVVAEIIGRVGTDGLRGRERRALAEVVASARDGATRPGARRLGAAIVAAVPAAATATLAGASTGTAAALDRAALSSVSTASSAPSPPDATAETHASNTDTPDGARPRAREAPVEAPAPALPPRRPEAETADGPTPASTAPTRRVRHGGSVALGIVGAVLVGAAVLTGLDGARPTLDAAPAHGRPDGPPAVAEGPPVPQTPASTTDDASPPAPSPTAPSPAAATSTPAAVPDRPSVVLEGRTFRVGEPGDEPAVGDWRCDGRPSVVVLRPATGTLFLFSSWAEPGHDVTATPIARVAPGSHLMGGDDPDAGGPCGTVGLRSGEGAAARVALDATSVDPAGRTEPGS